MLKMNIVIRQSVSVAADHCNMSRVMRKPVFGAVQPQKIIKISDVGSRGIALSIWQKQRC